MTLYIPVGPPASGKSTLAKAMIDTGVITERMIVSPDELRLWMTNRQADQTVNPQVFQIAEILAAERLKRGLSVFLDATNLNDPNGMLDRLTSHAAAWGRPDPVVWIRMDTDPDECKRRNALRADSVRVPEGVMDRMVARFLRWNPPAGAVVKSSSEFLDPVPQG